MQGRRTDRIADLIHRELALLIEREIKNPRVGFVTVTAVEVTPDMRSARIAVSVLGDAAKKEQSLKGLSTAQGFLRRELAHRLGLRHTPTLDFHLDKGNESGDRIDELLRQMHKPE